MRWRMSGAMSFMCSCINACCSAAPLPDISLQSISHIFVARRAVPRLISAPSREGGPAFRAAFIAALHPAGAAAPRSRSALVTTDTELRLMASAAIIGDSSSPVNG